MMDIMHVASYFLSRESMTLQKLQKLCYYAQGWALIRLNRRLFSEDVEAWLGGPCVPELHHHFKAYIPNRIPMMISYNGFKHAELDVLEFVYRNYVHYSGEELGWLSRNEAPWKNSRQDIAAWEGSREKISEESLSEISTEYIDAKMAEREVRPVSFGFKLWDFNLAHNEDALGRGDWFQELLTAMAEVTGKTKDELSKQGYLRSAGYKVKLLEQYGFKFNKKYKEQYNIEEIHLGDRECSIFGVFIDQVYHIVWFVSRKFRGPVVDIDERINMAMKEERQRRDEHKLFELEKENKELQNRNKELWDLLDEMTDPKIKMYKQ